jgi:hypothetical protein
VAIKVPYWQHLKRAAIGSLVLMATLLLLACNDDSDPAEPASAGADGGAACDQLEEVRQDLEQARTAALRGDRSGAQAAVNDARDTLQEIRSNMSSQPRNDAAAQAAGDLVGAVDGLQTNIRQAGQGGDSLLGVVQELETELPAIVSSLNSLRNELKCN